MADASLGGISPIRQCVLCAAEFQISPRGQRRKYCSRLCQDRAAKARGIGRTTVCEGCGEEFIPRGFDRTRYCSRACAHRNYFLDGRFTPVTCAVCEICATQYVSRRANYKHCKLKLTPKPKPVKTCRDCGSDLADGRRGSFRCSRCAEVAKIAAKMRGRVAAKARRRTDSHRIRKHIDRARRFGVAYQPINPMAIFARDGWQCQMCGRQTPELLRGTYDPQAPELDHIIPMSRGGAHVISNVQCACRSCNGAKGASLPVGHPQRGVSAREITIA